MEFIVFIVFLIFIVNVFLGTIEKIISSKSKPKSPLLKKSKPTIPFTNDDRDVEEYLPVKKDIPPLNKENNQPKSKFSEDYRVLNKLSYHFIESLEWKSFEQICFLYFQQRGYKSELSPFGADEGVDIYLYKPEDSFTPHVVVQCKAWHNRVGVAKIRELYGAMFAKKAKFAVFMAISGFTLDAENFAKDKTIELVDGKRLVSLIRKLTIDQQKNIIINIISKDYRTPTCPNCNIKMVIRRNKRNGEQFWGCRNFPRCRKTFKYNSKYHF